MRIVVTGAFGWTAASIVETLNHAGHEVTAFDLPSVVCPDGVKQTSHNVLFGDVADYKSVNDAVRLMDIIVHLAVAVGNDAYLRPDVPFRTNVKGTYNIFEAARMNQVQKVILMSSAPVHLPFVEKLSVESDWRSSHDVDHLYDLTKHLQEVIAQDFCETYLMNAVVLRAGHIVDGRKNRDAGGRSLEDVKYARGGWVCRYDLAAACLKAVEIAKPGFNKYYVIGAKDANEHFDVERAEKELGLKYTARFEQYK
jgi:nucleoside-diphosphate-sugar epimerase